MKFLGNIIHSELHSLHIELIDNGIHDLLLSFEQVPVQADGAEAYAVRCGNRIYVYAYNPSSQPVSALRVTLKGVLAGPLFIAPKAVPFDFGEDGPRFRGGKRIRPANGVLTIPVALAPRSEVLFEIKK